MVIMRELNEITFGYRTSLCVIAFGIERGFIFKISPLDFARDTTICSFLQHVYNKYIPIFSTVRDFHTSRTLAYCFSLLSEALFKNCYVSLFLSIVEA